MTINPQAPPFEREATEKNELPDHASEQDDRALAIDKVGIKGLSYPIQVLDRHQDTQHTIADVALYVSLPKHFKGTHMSRFVEVLNARRGKITIQNLPDMLSDIQLRLGARDAHVEFRFPYFISKRAPRSGVESLMEYTCSFRAAMRGPSLDFVVSVTVPVKSLCPCSKAVSRYGAHNQRSLVDVAVRGGQNEIIWIEDIVAAVEGCASAPLYTLLKREDEKYITELAYDNPKFVEDLVRDVVIAVKALPGVRWLRVSAENQESIHNHSAYAEIEWSLEAEQAARQPQLPLAARTSSEPEAFGSWIKRMRHDRSLTQQGVADHLGITSRHMSRVESGEKNLSADALDRLAVLLGLDPVEIRLRAGQPPPELLARVAADPAGFLAWAKGGAP